MNRRRFVVAALAAIATGAYAQASRPKRIGVLWVGSDKGVRDQLLPGVRKALARAGVIEGRHFEIDVEPSRDLAGLPAAASRLAGRKPDVVLTQGVAATRAIAQSAPATPIVTSVPDPVAAGFAKSLARPGGNVTGIARGAPEVPRKALEMVARIIPQRSRVAIVCRDTPADREFAARVEAAAGEAGLNAAVEAIPADNMAQAFAGIDGKRTPAVFLVSSVEADVLSVLAREATRKRLVAATFEDAGADAGFLLAINARQDDYFERTAAMLAKIVNGAKAGEIPFETPTRHDVVLNRATARALRITVPPDVQMRADRVT